MPTELLIDFNEFWARLREDIAAGRAPRRPGTATVLSWTKR